jgi:hypothetical protein
MQRERGGGRSSASTSVRAKIDMEGRVDGEGKCVARECDASNSWRGHCSLRGELRYGHGVENVVT